MATESLAPPSPVGTRWARLRDGLTGREWAGVAGMTAVVVGLTVVGWGVLIFLVVPGHYSVGTKTFGIGIGVTAYTLGMRHAFDADHIAAIDNTTRKLMAARNARCRSGSGSPWATPAWCSCWRCCSASG